MFKRILAQKKRNILEAKRLSAQDWPDIKISGSLIEQISTNSKYRSNREKTLGVYITLPFNTGGKLFYERAGYH